ncbi:hypothetical protein, partial [Kibdelosporangium persicum]
MIDAGIARLQSTFSRRFVVGTFYPVLLVFIAAAVLYLAATGRAGPVFTSFARLPGVTQALMLAGVLLVLATTAHILSSFHPALTRFYEGYWPRRLSRLRTRMIARHRRRWRAMADAEAQARAEGRHQDANDLQLTLARSYPPSTRPDAFLPTRLGNVLRTAEIYPHERYGIDAVIIWPRLRHILPTPTVDELVETRTAMASLLLLRTLCTAFGIVAPITIIATTQSWWLAAASLTAWLVASISHRAAVQLGRTYADHVRTVFDLHRLELIKHLGLETPTTLSAERLLWDDLTQFYFRNLPHSLPQRQPTDDTTEPTAPPEP